MNAATLEPVAVAKPKKREKTVLVRHDEDLIDMARMVASHKKKSLPEWLDEVLTPVVRKEYERMIDALNASRSHKDSDR